MSEKVRVRNVSGLHLRPANELVSICSKYACDILIVSPAGKVNPKSILMLMGAGIKAGTEIEVVCDGEGEADALKSIIEAIKGGFGEEMID